MFRFALLLAVLAFPGLVVAQDPTVHAGHHGADGGSPGPVSEGGQSAFAAIREIVALLVADPDTDWSRVDIEALRRHLIDMDNVTLRARVTAREIDGGARFEATSGDPAVTDSIRSMLSAHAATMDGVDGLAMGAEDIAGGAALTVTGADPGRIRGLGLIGVMVMGMHHQAHHLAIATGRNPHAR